MSPLGGASCRLAEQLWISNPFRLPRSMTALELREISGKIDLLLTDVVMHPAFPARIWRKSFIPTRGRDESDLHIGATRILLSLRTAF